MEVLTIAQGAKRQGASTEEGKLQARKRESLQASRIHGIAHRECLFRRWYCHSLYLSPVLLLSLSHKHTHTSRLGRLPKPSCVFKIFSASANHMSAYSSFHHKSNLIFVKYKPLEKKVYFCYHKVSFTMVTYLVTHDLHNFK